MLDFLTISPEECKPLEIYRRFFSYIYACMYAFRCVYYGTVVEVGCVTISSEMKIIHFSRKLLKTTQNSLRESLKLTRLTRSFPPRVSKKKTVDSQTNQTVKMTLTPNQFPRGSRDWMNHQEKV